MQKYCYAFPLSSCRGKYETTAHEMASDNFMIYPEVLKFKKQQISGIKNVTFCCWVIN